MKDNQIFKIYGTDFKENTKKILEASDLAGRIPGRETRIAIKPNLVSESDPSMGAVTHPEIVEGIIEYLRERGFENLVIAESSWVGSRTRDVIEAAGYDALLARCGVPFLDMQKDAAVTKDAAGLELHVCRSTEEFGFLINVPVMKGHCQTKITCALKNMKGLIPNTEKRRFHSLGLHKPIAHLATVLHPDFIVVDHICGDLDFEDGGHPVVRNCIMTGIDPVLMDAYVCHLMHYEVSEVPYIVLAEQLGCGSTDLSRAEITVLGGADEEAGEALPAERRIVAVEDTVDEVESCSACYGSLIPALDRLREEGLLERLDEKICIGQGFKGKTGALGAGACTRHFAYTVPGCPPTENQMYESLKAYIESRNA